MTHAKMLASVELARGALAARCRLRRGGVGFGAREGTRRDGGG